MIIALGSNIGDPSKHLLAAVQAIKAVIGANIRCSSAYQTEPIGMDANADRFLNAVLTGQTTLSALALLTSLQKIEVAMGRDPKRGLYRSRSIDLDMITYGEQIIASHRLTIPHPRAKERLFVLLPLMELLPDLILPGEVVSVRQLAADAPSMAISYWGRLDATLPAYGVPSDAD